MAKILSSKFVQIVETGKHYDKAVKKLKSAVRAGLSGMPANLPESGKGTDDTANGIDPVETANVSNIDRDVVEDISRNILLTFDLFLRYNVKPGTDVSVKTLVLVLKPKPVRFQFIQKLNELPKISIGNGFELSFKMTSKPSKSGFYGLSSFKILNEGKKIREILPVDFARFLYCRQLCDTYNFCFDHSLTGFAVYARPAESFGLNFNYKATIESYQQRLLHESGTVTDYIKLRNEGKLEMFDNSKGCLEKILDQLIESFPNDKLTAAFKNILDILDQE